MTDDRRDRLEAAARERWGDEWFIVCHIDADGDEQYHAAHTETRLADGVVVRSQLWINGGDLTESRWVIDTKEYVTRLSDGLDRKSMSALLEYEP